jgi:hypothetical protein
MNRAMFSSPAGSPGSPGGAGDAVYEVKVTPIRLTSSADCERLFEQLRPAVLKHRQRNPGATELVLATPLGTVCARLRKGGDPAGEVRFALAPESRGSTAPSPTEPAAVQIVALPDDHIYKTSQRLVDAGDARARLDALLRLAVGHPTGATGAGPVLPPAFTAEMERRIPMAVLAGAPGTGKTSETKAALDGLCRTAGVPGYLAILPLDRGNGLVGSLGSRVHAAFDALDALPADGLRALLIDEAEALVPARGGANLHHEDRVGCSVFLQRLDRLAGVPNTLVILTTNLLESMDAAIIRRGHTIAFARPDQTARAALLSRWLPNCGAAVHRKAALAATGMTFADIDRCLFGLYAETVANGRDVTAPQVVTALRRGERTRER